MPESLHLLSELHREGSHSESSAQRPLLACTWVVVAWLAHGCSVSRCAICGADAKELVDGGEFSDAPIPKPAAPDGAAGAEAAHGRRGAAAGASEEHGGGGGDDGGARGFTDPIAAVTDAVAEWVQPAAPPARAGPSGPGHAGEGDDVRGGVAWMRAARASAPPARAAERAPAGEAPHYLAARASEPRESALADEPPHYLAARPARGAAPPPGGAASAKPDDTASQLSRGWDQLKEAVTGGTPKAEAPPHRPTERPARSAAAPPGSSQPENGPAGGWGLSGDPEPASEAGQPEQPEQQGGAERTGAQQAGQGAPEGEPKAAPEGEPKRAPEGEAARAPEGEPKAAPEGEEGRVGGPGQAGGAAARTAEPRGGDFYTDEVAMDVGGADGAPAADAEADASDTGLSKSTAALTQAR
jgi:hypothetical protein